MVVVTHNRPASIDELADEIDRRGEVIERLETAAAYHRETLAQMMMACGFATGHGDDIADLLHELEWQLKERRARAEAAEQRLADAAAAFENIAGGFIAGLGQAFDRGGHEALATELQSYAKAHASELRAFLQHKAKP